MINIIVSKFQRGRVCDYSIPPVTTDQGIVLPEKGRFALKKISLARADIILIIIIILSQKNSCDSEIVLFSFFFNHNCFVLYVLGKDSEFLDIKEDLCGKQRGVSTSFIPLTSRFGLIILIYYNIDLDQVLFS